MAPIRTKQRSSFQDDKSSEASSSHGSGKGTTSLCKTCILCFQLAPVNTPRPIYLSLRFDETYIPPEQITRVRCRFMPMISEIIPTKHDIKPVHGHNKALPVSQPSERPAKSAKRCVSIFPTTKFFSDGVLCMDKSIDKKVADSMMAKHEIVELPFRLHSRNKNTVLELENKATRIDILYSARNGCVICPQELYCHIRNPYTQAYKLVEVDGAIEHYERYPYEVVLREQEALALEHGTPVEVRHNDQEARGTSTTTALGDRKDLNETGIPPLASETFCLNAESKKSVKDEEQ